MDIQKNHKITNQTKFCCCLHTAEWKREEILDHSFKLIDVNDYVDNSTVRRVKYLWIFFLVFKTVMVYMFDLYLLGNSFIEYIGKKSEENGKIPEEKDCDTINVLGINIDTKFMCDFAANDSVQQYISYSFFILLATISITYILSYLEYEKSRKIIKSQDISFSYTSIMTYRYYCIKSYAYYCFFQQIQDHQKFIDDVAFFVFFTFKGWKRFLFADTPRRVINILNFINTLVIITKNNNSNSGNNSMNYVSLVSSSFILLSWISTGILLIISFIVYIPLLFVIQGNLKEYCCHKIDKRIGEIINNKTQQRIRKIQKVEKAKIETARKLGVNPNQLHLDESARKKGFDLEILPDPTLPQIDVDLTSNANDTYYTNQYQNQYQNQNQNQFQYTNPPFFDYDNYSNDSGSNFGSLPYNNTSNRAVTQQPKPQYMNSPYNSPYNAPYNSKPRHIQPKTTIRSQGSSWNDQQSNSSNGMLPPSRPRNGSSTWNDVNNSMNRSNNNSINETATTTSNNSNQLYRRNINNDTVSIHSDDPLVQPPRSNYHY